MQVLRLRAHTSAYVSIRQHPSASVSIRQHTYTSAETVGRASPQASRAYVSIRQHTSAYVYQCGKQSGVQVLRLRAARVIRCVFEVIRITAVHKDVVLDTVSIRQHTSDT
jgi:hypothetical protein